MSTTKEKQTGQVTALPATIATTSYSSLAQRARSSPNVGSRYLCRSKSRVRTPTALLRAERPRSAGIRLQRQCQKMDCAFRIRREYRTGQTKSRDVRRGLPQTGREPRAPAIEVEGIPRSIARACPSCSRQFAGPSFFCPKQRDNASVARHVESQSAARLALPRGSKCPASRKAPAVLTLLNV